MDSPVVSPPTERGIGGFRDRTPAVAGLHRGTSPAARRRIRVLVVGPMRDPGGLARVARMSAEGFDPRRCDVRVCDTSREGGPDRSLVRKCAGHLRRLLELVRALRAHQPHVVHLHTCSYGTYYRTMLDALVCMAARRRYVLHVHGGLFADFLAGLQGLRRKIALWCLRRAHAVAVLSESWRTNLTRIAGGMRICVIPNAVELAELRAADLARGGGVQFVGDLGETKRPEDLLVAFSALPGALRKRYPLTLIGDGEPQRRRLLEQLAERLGILPQVTFTGPLSNGDAQRRLARADLFVLPSRAEGMPVALLEAMAAGVASIATRVGAVPEVVRDGQEAVLVDPLDPAGLARTMKSLLENPARRQALGQAAADRVQQEYSPARFHQALFELWHSVAPEVTPPPVELPRLATSTFRSIL